MPQVIITPRAAAGLERCRKFLQEKNPLAASRVGRLLAHHFTLLETEPNMGRPFIELPNLRELLIEFGDSGYVILYRYEVSSDRIAILAFCHQKEAGY